MVKNHMLQIYLYYQIIELAYDVQYTTRPICGEKQSSAIQNAINITEQVGCYTPHSTPPQAQGPSDEP